MLLTDHLINQIFAIFLKQTPNGNYILRIQRKNGVYLVSLQLSFIKQESSFQRTARPPRKKVLGFIPGLRASSAYGYSQALDGTRRNIKFLQAIQMLTEKILKMQVIYRVVHR